MKIAQLGVLFALCTLFFSCSKDEANVQSPDLEENETQNPPETPAPEPVVDKEVYFEAFIGKNLNTEDSDNWLLVHDEEGVLLDYKPFEENDNLIFEMDSDKVPDKFTVTHFFVFTLTGNAAFNLTTYTEVNKGSKWIVGNLNSEPYTYVEPEVTGNFDITIAGDFVPPSMRVISNSEGNGEGNGAFSITTDSFTGDWLYKKNAELFVENDYYITLMSGSGETSYYLLTDVQNGDVYNLEYDSFSEFDSHMNMVSPLTSKIYFSLRGYTQTPTSIASPGYDFYKINGLVSGNGIYHDFNVGYFGNKFEAYSFYLNAILEDYSYTHYYLGTELPNELIVPERPSFTIDNPDIQDFKFSTDIAYNRKVNSWASDQAQRPTYWYVYSSSASSVAIGALPEELMTMYPEMDISELSYQSSLLFIDSKTHSEYMDAVFSGESQSNKLKTDIYFTL
ncbi:MULTISPECIES: hypothetical protein [Flavobacteriaceae]|uniref:hypothetical protein n=1 Tax=Flavobacteriaceae TaxID=49546 RepID=UPI0023494467|nr:hypothetical protein [Muricauda sp. SP22]MDC6362000.1 hypothetical protein [Muricauda sp. SP22]